MIKRIDKKTGVITLKDSKPKGKRGFASVNNPQFLSSWSTPTTDASTEQRNAAERLRNQARDLERNNSYVVRFLNEWISNIVGTGYNFSSLAVNAQGREDKGAREIIENAWKD
ncbi:MAG: phage portal protein, partial [bacterium]|nr:phage portal protein [bacterium]